MATRVGEADDLGLLLRDCIALEHDAIAAYEAAIDRLENAVHKVKLHEFRRDHQRHLTELTELAVASGAPVPAEGEEDRFVTSGTIRIARAPGEDAAVLRAIDGNEADTLGAYERAADNGVVPPRARQLFVRALEDERRHKAWTAAAADSA